MYMYLDICTNAILMHYMYGWSRDLALLVSSLDLGCTNFLGVSYVDTALRSEAGTLDKIAVYGRIRCNYDRVAKILLQCEWNANCTGLV